jgi:uncharacterized repeat protein (TIGR03803 family)
LKTSFARALMTYAPWDWRKADPKRGKRWPRYQRSKKKPLFAANVHPFLGPGAVLANMKAQPGRERLPVLEHSGALANSCDNSVVILHNRHDRQLTQSLFALGKAGIVRILLTAYTLLLPWTLAEAVEPELIYYWDHLVQPYAALAEAPDHSFYSTTAGQAFYDDYGSVYRVTTNGTSTTLAHFGAPNGVYPNSLTLANDNNFYGTTKYGGAYGYGTVFRLSTNGQLTTLVSFNYTNGATPFAALLRGTDGFLYGSTYTGGKTNSLNIAS